MKKSFITLLALVSTLFVSTSVMAWDRPTEPAKPTEAGEFAVGKSYFVRNVATGQYLTGSNDWSTQISLTTDGIDDESSQAFILLVENLTLTYEGVAVSGYGLRMNGSFNVNGAGGSRSFTNTYLFRDSEGWGYIDWANQPKGRVWNITKSGEYYRIQTAAADPAFPDAATQYAGWLSDLAIGQGGTTAVRFDLTANDANIDWEFIPADDYLYQMSLFPARQELYDALIEADEKGIDTSAAGEVYTNPDATVDQIKAAITDLKAAIFSLWYDFSGASMDTPLDVTSQVIANPNFNSNIDGWTYEGISFQFMSRTDGIVDANKNYVQITNFAESWIWSPNTLGDGRFYYTAYGLPSGIYKLECDAMATKQKSEDPEGLVEGAFIFVESANRDLCEPLPFKAPDGQPKHWSVTFVSDGSPAINFGIRTVSTTANWVSCDNWKLTYYGETQKTTEQIQLETAISEAEAIDLNVRCEEAKMNAFTSALSNAKAVVSSTDAEALTSAKAALEEAQAALLNSIEDYKTAHAFIYKKLVNAKKSIETQWPTLAETLGTWYEQLETYYNIGLLTSQGIAALDGQLVTKVRDYIADTGDIKDGYDLTLLIENADYETLGKSNKIVPGWTVVSGSITDHSTAYFNIEAFHTTFDIQQTIKNMPAGAYDVTVQGYVANEGTQNCELYAGTTVTSFKEIKDEYSTYAILANGTDEETGLGTSNGGWPCDRRFTLDGTTVYTPNSMQGAKLYFETENPATGEPFYTNHAVIILPEAGDLTIGVRTTGDREWILWDNFRITYRGNHAADYYEEINRLLSELNAAGQADNAFITKKANTYLTELPQKAETVMANADADECLALIEELTEAISYIKEGNSKGEELGELWEYYDILKDEVASTDTTYPALLETVNEAMSDPKTKVAENSVIDNYIQNLNIGWKIYFAAATNIGDINGDSRVSVADLTALLNLIAEQEDYSPKADVNRDGRITRTDVTALVNTIIGTAGTEYKYYFGVTQPTADNFYFLTNVENKQYVGSSLADINGKSITTDSSGMIYFVCPKSNALTDAQRKSAMQFGGGYVKFGADIDTSSIPEYLIYSTSNQSAGGVYTLNIASNDGTEEPETAYYWYVGNSIPTSTSGTGWTSLGTDLSKVSYIQVDTSNNPDYSFPKFYVVLPTSLGFKPYNTDGSKDESAVWTSSESSINEYTLWSLNDNTSDINSRFQK